MRKLIPAPGTCAGYSYTGGPKPIAYGPFGEFYVLFFFGIAAVGGSNYLQTLAFGWPVFWTGVALGLPAAAVLVVNNYRDLETDRVAGRQTLCHFLGRPRTRLLYAALLIAPIPILTTAGLPGSTWTLFAALPLAVMLIIRFFRGATGEALNLQPARTALLALLILGFVLA